MVAACSHQAMECGARKFRISAIVRPDVFPRHHGARGLNTYQLLFALDRVAPNASPGRRFRTRPVRSGPPGISHAGGETSGTPATVAPAPPATPVAVVKIGSATAPASATVCHQGRDPTHS